MLPVSFLAVQYLFPYSMVHPTELAELKTVEIMP